MQIQLQDTNSSQILAELQKARSRMGAASGMVMTLLIDVYQPHLNHIEGFIMEAAREHPSRIVILATNPAQEMNLNATIRTGEDFPGEVITLRVGGISEDRIRSIILPLLLPDSPVIAWWPFEAPKSLAKSTIGVLADRRIADSGNCVSPFAALMARSREHQPGDSDLAWGRLTLWRAVLAMALDQCPNAKVLSAQVEAEDGNAPSHLLGAWLRYSLKVPVKLVPTEGPGLTGVRLETEQGEIALVRRDSFSADYIIPGQPDRRVALKRRDINELITEELRHMDGDPMYAKVIQKMLEWHDLQEKRDV